MSRKKENCLQPVSERRAVVSAGLSSRGRGKKTAETKKELAVIGSAEAILLDRVLAGEDELFYELVRPHQTMLFGMAMAIVKDEAEAEDAVQETMVKALTKLGTFRREARFGTWLARIVINAARMKLRKNRRHVHEPLEERDGSDEGEYYPRDLADWREIPSEALERRELRNALRRAIEALPRLYREVMVLRDVHKLSTIETAAMLGTTVAAVKSRLLRARLQVRDALAPGIDGAWSLGETKWRRVRPW